MKCLVKLCIKFYGCFNDKIPFVYNEYITIIIDIITGKYIGKAMEYSLTAPKPTSEFHQRLFSLSAVVNVGWCSR